MQRDVVILDVGVRRQHDVGVDALEVEELQGTAAHHVLDVAEGELAALEELGAARQLGRRQLAAQVEVEAGLDLDHLCAHPHVSIGLHVDVEEDVLREQLRLDPAYSREPNPSSDASSMSFE